MANKAKHFWIEPDELSRKGLDFCSLAAQGLWLKVMRLMHDSERYGYLSRDGKAISDEQLARRCGVDGMTLLTLVEELIDFDLLKRTADGILFSPELVAQEEWRSKEAKRKKDQRKRGMSQECPAESPGECPADVPSKSRSNSKLLKPSSFSNEKKDGGGARAREEKQPPPDETQEDYLLRKQLEFPKLDIQAVFKRYLDYCKTNHLQPKRRFFDYWLETEDEPMTADFETKSARQIAIENCAKCDENGLVKTEGKFKECNHK